MNYQELRRMAKIVENAKKNKDPNYSVFIAMLSKRLGLDIFETIEEINNFFHGYIKL